MQGFECVTLRLGQKAGVRSIRQTYRSIPRYQGTRGLRPMMVAISCRGALSPFHLAGVTKTKKALSPDHFREEGLVFRPSQTLGLWSCQMKALLG